MVNYRVEELHAVLTALKAEGCNVLDKIDDSEYASLPGSSILRETRSHCGIHLPVNDPPPRSLRQSRPTVPLG
jgi:hypothetical protein